MTREVTTSGLHERLAVLWALLWPLLLLGTGLRVALHLAFRDEAFSVGTFAYLLAIGFVLDACASIVLLAPAVLGLALVATRITARGVVLGALATAVVQAGLFWLVDAEFGRLHALVTLALTLVVVTSFVAGVLLARHRGRMIVLCALFTAAAFGAAVEFCFFEEFNSRYNHIALDYLLYPGEVATNVWESYPVPLVAGGAVVVGITLAWLAGRRLPRGPLPVTRASRALSRGVAAVVLLLACAFVAGAIPASVADNRITSEIAQNGLVGLVRAWRTAELQYDAYYATVPTPEARTRTAAFLGFPAPTPAQLAAPAGEFELQRRIGTPGRRPLDVVVVLEESLGSPFVGVLGAKRGDLTPCIDRWSRSGLLLENLVATGNRTVRGLEGVLCSFVPLPGDSITKRTPPSAVATIARVFASHEYETAFFYGGAGTFDGMEPFMSKNGWNTFFEQRDFPPGCFTTAWGVADEHIFDALLEHQEAAAREGRRFFGTLLSVSNHKPYLVPAGRTPIADGPRSREGAVSYSDWAIGRYLDAAQAKGLLEHTVVLIVGDHGARAYGRELIPVDSYRIPALFLSPDAQWKGRRFTPLCSQVDLAPTLVSLAGLEAEVPFLGRDLTSLADGPGRAFVQHNRDVGVLTDDLLVVLGLQKTVTFYERDGRGANELRLVAHDAVTARMRELERDAAAVFGTAYELHRSGRYLPPGAAAAEGGAAPVR